MISIFSKKKPFFRRAAIFDLDGTLIPNASAEYTFFSHLISTGRLTLIDILSMTRALLTVRLNWHNLTRANKNYLRGKNVSLIKDFAKEYFEPEIDKLVFPAMQRLIQLHRSRGDLILMLTGTLDFIAASFASKLKFDGYQATQLEINKNKFTGRVFGVLPYGLGKLEVLREMRDKYHFDLNITTFYANVYSDRYVMNTAMEPVAVNPDRRLRAYARKRGWQIIDVAG